MMRYAHRAYTFSLLTNLPNYTLKDRRLMSLGIRQKACLNNVIMRYVQQCEILINILLILIVHFYCF